MDGRRPPSAPGVCGNGDGMENDDRRAPAPMASAAITSNDGRRLGCVDDCPEPVSPRFAGNGVDDGPPDVGGDPVLGSPPRSVNNGFDDVIRDEFAVVTFPPMWDDIAEDEKRANDDCMYKVDMATHASFASNAIAGEYSNRLPFHPNCRNTTTSCVSSPMALVLATINSSKPANAPPVPSFNAS